MAFFYNGNWIYAAKRCLSLVILFLFCFFLIMGGIFTSIMPEARYTLIQSMTVFGVTMGALIGLPPSLVEIYSSNIKNVYKANGVPLSLGLIVTNISAYILVSHERYFIFCRASCFSCRSSGSSGTVFFMSCCFYCRIAWHSQHHRAGCKGSGQNIHGFDHCLSPRSCCPAHVSVELLPKRLKP